MGGSKAGSKAPYLLLVLDDILGTTADKAPVVQDLYSRGRHERIGVIVLSQAANHVPTPIMKANSSLLMWCSLNQDSTAKLHKSLTIKPAKTLPQLVEWCNEVAVDRTFAAYTGRNNALFPVRADAEELDNVLNLPIYVEKKHEPAEKQMTAARMMQRNVRIGVKRQHTEMLDDSNTAIGDSEDDETEAGAAEEDDAEEQAKPKEALIRKRKIVKLTHEEGPSGLALGSSGGAAGGAGAQLDFDIEILDETPKLFRTTSALEPEIFDRGKPNSQLLSSATGSLALLTGVFNWDVAQDTSALLHNQLMALGMKNVDKSVTNFYGWIRKALDDVEVMNCADPTIEAMLKAINSAISVVHEEDVLHMLYFLCVVYYRVRTIQPYMTITESIPEAAGDFLRRMLRRLKVFLGDPSEMPAMHWETISGSAAENIAALFKDVAAVAGSE
jgi:hypothetical protein